MTSSKPLRFGFREQRRTRVLWHGEAAIPAAIFEEFQNRGLSPERITEAIKNGVFEPSGPVDRLSSEALSHLAASRAFVFFTDKRTVMAHSEFLDRVGRHLVDHGLLLCFYVEDRAVGDKMLKVIQGLAYVSKKLGVEIPVIYLGPREWPGAPSSKSSAHEFPERISQWDSGPDYEGELKIEGSLKDPSHELLLRRAFGNCKEITVKNVEGGFSAAGVYFVSAILRNAAFVSRPLPFFAKIDSLPKVIQEMGVYRELVHPGIPFNSRPTLNLERSFLAHSYGVIVGDFVEDAESFYDIVKRGDCQRPIHSLFDHALRGWRGQAYESTSAVREGNIVEDLFREVNTQVPSTALVKAAWSFGARRSYEQMKSALIGIGNMAKYRVAPFHGDLYGNNIRVRDGDSILIDFASTKIAVSLMADPAYLEVSLAFNEYMPGDRFRDWENTIRTLYSPDMFRRAPEPPLRPALREWLWNAVRHIRLVALGAQESPPKEYQTVLAFFLLRESGFDPTSDTFGKRHRRAYAYAMADRLITDLIESSRREPRRFLRKRP